MSSQDDDQTRQLMNYPAHVQQKSSGGFMEYVKNNKLMVAIIIIIIIALIWWFCLRKNTTNVTTNVSGVPGATVTVPTSNANSKVKITRNQMW